MFIEINDARIPVENDTVCILEKCSKNDIVFRLKQLESIKPTYSIDLLNEIASTLNKYCGKNFLGGAWLSKETKENIQREADELRDGFIHYVVTGFCVVDAELIINYTNSISLFNSIDDCEVADIENCVLPCMTSIVASISRELNVIKRSTFLILKLKKYEKLQEIGVKLKKIIPKLKSELKAIRLYNNKISFLSECLSNSSWKDMEKSIIKSKTETYVFWDDECDFNIHDKCIEIEKILSTINENSPNKAYITN